MQGADTLKGRMQAVIDRHGPWTSHNIYLGDEVYTIDRPDRPKGESVRRMVQIVSDLARRPLNELRVLDLGALEGLYAIEFARQGAQAVAIEGREMNLEKARFVKEALDLSHLDLHLDDVRNLSVEKYGQFDVVLCLGLLYHLNAPDVFNFIKSMAQVCTHLLVIHSHISLAPQISVVYEGQPVYGRRFVEYPEGITEADMRSRAWSALNNAESFWITLPSLLNLLGSVGFTSVHQTVHPGNPGQLEDQRTLIAIKGAPVTIHSNPVANSLPRYIHPEKQPRQVHPAQRYPPWIQSAYNRTPESIKRVLRRIRR
jgi:2-polyprenyl-3-methyl-5-hydroxy-6-metoxy-1,4-benzoquinol methylase